MHPKRSRLVHMTEEFRFLFGLISLWFGGQLCNTALFLAFKMGNVLISSDIRRLYADCLNVIVWTVYFRWYQSGSSWRVEILLFVLLLLKLRSGSSLSPFEKMSLVKRQWVTFSRDPQFCFLTRSDLCLCFFSFSVSKNTKYVMHGYISVLESGKLRLLSRWFLASGTMNFTTGRKGLNFCHTDILSIQLRPNRRDCRALAYHLVCCHTNVCWVFQYILVARLAPVIVLLCSSNKLYMLFTEIIQSKYLF